MEKLALAEVVICSFPDSAGPDGNGMMIIKGLPLIEKIALGTVGRSTDTLCIRCDDRAEANELKRALILATS